MKNKCIPVDRLVFWTIAGYAAYALALYLLRKPACAYATKLCDKISTEDRI